MALKAEQPLNGSAGKAENGEGTGHWHRRRRALARENTSAWWSADAGNVCLENACLANACVENACVENACLENACLENAYLSASLLRHQFARALPPKHQSV
ncbi:hypothetical protein GGP72_003308 [Salinibacter ruber]|uniref:Uncharacterized protein n=1 Tax=Salinibacter ruber TaxID=146919 RepID=A0A9X2Q4B5_9BACT|nr:hypothetical protein [Salinibacter ruber]MCS3679358.1 hypothetical protein [Salinibacter ruber]MCS3682644.1 hypothetical protein [Salinibacter ruber]